ncbi:hypothetical protein TL16_g00209 [Triparma laevis f. inornata]|uniref:Uncharacterized protein n=1 Tax=Triparma laevis f. inornata TaxID=1714386 RepID=A0A9W6ZCU5_9STRA|nr:hypothetical protein TL16_g00209 [Triparma laevis f. inornata]
MRALSMKMTMLRMRGLETLQSFLGISHGMRPEGFGTILRMVPTRVEGDSKVVSDYDVPKHLCTKATKNDTAKLPLSVLMSVFDDVSTWPIVVKDKQHRPGVSVHLSAELLDPSRPISPSTPLRIESTVDKSGRMLAFCSIHAYNRDSGELVATGKHTKFLPMGFVFEFMFQRFMPLLHLYASNFGPYRNSNDMLMKNGTSKNILDIIGPLEMTTSGTTTETNFRVGPLHKNPMGGMHGGCQSVVSQLVAEAGVSDLTASSGAKKKKPVLRSMSMTYMSTGRKQVRCTRRALRRGDFSGD